jgi:hypothetical protein
MARLRVQEQARARNMSLAQLQYAVSTRLGQPVPLNTLRRYWHSTKNGLISGEPIELVDVDLLGDISRVLDVPVAALLDEATLGKARA